MRKLLRDRSESQKQEMMLIGMGGAEQAVRAMKAIQHSQHTKVVDEPVQ